MSTNRIKEPLLATLEELVSTDLKTFQWYLNQSVLDGFHHIPKSHLENADRTDTVDKMVDVYGPDRALKITLEILRKMNQNDSAERLMKNCQTGVTVTGGNRSTRSLPVEGKSPSFRSSVTTETGVQAAGSGGNSTKDEPCDESTAYKRRLQDQLRVMFHKISEGVKKQGKKTLLRNIYTELYVTETTSGDVNFEHEVRQIETASRKLARSEVPIAFNYIFKPSEGQDTIIRTVLTKGVAGIGKTVSVAKFILDWAEGKSNQDIQFIFPLMFRQINLLRQENYSLVDLLLECISEATSMSASDKTFLRRIFCHLQTSQTSIDHGREYKTLFVLDGLDECRPPLDSFNCRSCSDVTEPTSVAVLLTNLIKGKLLPSALLWITSRPAAANQIPSDYLDLVTEVRGFNDPQKEEYFMKKIKDEDQARRIFTHVKSSRTLYIMCHIPVFSWISATVLEKMDTEGGEMPKTLTQMYTQFVIVQVKQKNVKFREKTETEPHWDEENKQMISSLGKLAYEQLERGHLVFDEKDLEECGIDVKAAAVYSGVCTEMLAEDCGVWQRKAYCFVHLSIQECLAALYVLLSFNNDNVDLMADQRPNEPKTHLNLKAIDRALQSESGYWDLMLRFLLGLSLESNQVRLQGLLRLTRNSSQSHKETVAYIRERIRMNPSPERCMNLFHCLNELNDHSLLDTLQSYLMSGNMARRHLLPEQWSALAFVLLTSDQELEVFDMKKYSRSEDGLQRLLPVVKASRTALLNHCHLSENCCDMLASALSSSKLRELDLSSNRLHDSGVKMISSGLGNPHCQLETLSLSDCLLTGKGCRYLTLSLTSNPTPLKVLDLSNNDLRNSGVKMLSDLLKDPRCVLESLRLSGCQITSQGCASLASALSSNSSRLCELDLSYNHPGTSGVKTLSALLNNPIRRLEKLNVDHGGALRMRAGHRKYACELTLNPNTAHSHLSLSEEDRKVTRRKQQCRDHPERFDYWYQVLCREGLPGRCYWEAEWRGGRVCIGATYEGIGRKGWGDECALGYNHMSWGLICDDDSYSAWYNTKKNDLPVPPSGSHRVGVYLDWPAGILSFYRVFADTLTHLYTFRTTFTEPLYAGFRLVSSDSSVSLC